MFAAATAAELPPTDEFAREEALETNNVAFIAPAQGLAEGKDSGEEPSALNFLEGGVSGKRRSHMRLESTTNLFYSKV